MTFVKQIQLGIDLVQPLQPAPTPGKFLKQNPESLERKGKKKEKEKGTNPALPIVALFSGGCYSFG